MSKKIFQVELSNGINIPNARKKYSNTEVDVIATKSKPISYISVSKKKIVVSGCEDLQEKIELAKPLSLKELIERGINPNQPFIKNYGNQVGFPMNPIEAQKLKRQIEKQKAQLDKTIKQQAAAAAAAAEAAEAAAAAAAEVKAEEVK